VFRIDLRGLILCSLAGLAAGSAVLTYFWALREVNGSLAAMIVSLTPLLALGLLALRGERFTSRNLVRVALGLAGIYLLIGPGGNISVRGLLLLLGTAVSFAIHIVMIQWYLNPRGDIHTLVMTHSDIDHLGGIHNFPRAPIVIGLAERAQPTPRYFGYRSPIDWPQDVEYQLVDEDTLLGPGVTLLTTPGHSPGHLSLPVQLAETGAVLITGDAIARPAEFEVGFGDAWVEDVARTSAERLMRIAEREQAFIIYGHDPAQRDSIRKVPEFYS